MSTDLPALMDMKPRLAATLVGNPGGRVLQSIVRAPWTGDYYASYIDSPVTGGSGNVRVARLDSTGKLLDYAVLEGAGHGVSIAAEYEDGQVWLWLFWGIDLAVPTGTAVRWAYTGTPSGARVLLADAETVYDPGSGTADHTFGYFSIDQAADTICTYFRDSARTEHYTRYKLSDYKAGTATPLATASHVWPAGNVSAFQGFSATAEHVYISRGGSSVTDQTPTLYELDWATGNITSSMDISGLVASTSAGPDGAHNEPEGVCVWRDESGTPELLFGIDTGPLANRYGQVYRLAAAVDGTASKTVHIDAERVIDGAATNVTASFRYSNTVRYTTGGMTAKAYEDPIDLSQQTTAELKVSDHPDLTDDCFGFLIYVTLAWDNAANPGQRSTAKYTAQLSAADPNVKLLSQALVADGTPAPGQMIRTPGPAGDPGGQGDPGIPGKDGGASITDGLTAYRQYGTKSLSVAVAGDTTWVRDWATTYGAKLNPALSRTYRVWNGTSWDVTNDSVGDGGTPGTPGTGGTVLADTFTRTGQVSGSTPDSGTNWGGSTLWSANGSTASASGVGSIGVDTGAVDGLTMTAILQLTTSATSAPQTWRFYLAAGAPSGGSVSFNSGIWATLTIAASGAVSAALAKTVSGTTTTLTTCPTTGIANASSSAQQATVTLGIASGVATLTITPPTGSPNTVTAAVTSADFTSTWAGIGQASTAAAGMKMDQVTLATPYVPGTPATPAEGITISAHPGLSTSDLSEAFTSDPTMLLVAADATQSAAFITAFRAAHPTTPATVVAGADVPALTMPATPAPAATGRSVAFAKLQSLAGVGDGQCRIGVISDSTANDVQDWVRVWHQNWGATLPATVNRTYQAWNDTTSAWGTPVVDNAGDAPDTGVILADTFTRTASELVGSTPDTGPAWTGQTGGWTIDGAHAVPAKTSGNNVGVNLNSPDQSATINLIVNTTAPAATQTFRLYLGAGGYGTGIYAFLTLTTAGALTIQLFKNLQGGSGNAALGSAVTVAGVTAGQTGVPVKLAMSTQTQNASATVTVAGQATTVTGQIGEAETTQRQVSAYMGTAASALPHFAVVDDVRFQTPAADNPPPTPTLTVWNGATPGAGTVFWDAAKRAAVFGGKTLDIMLIALGHNQQSQNAPDYITAMTALVAAVRVEHPEATILVSSQNPEFAPAAGVANHRARQAALRAWATGQGLDYLPAYEAFAAKADGGQSLVDSGGVHPTTPTGGATTGDYGSVLWATTLTDTLNAG